MTTKIDPALSRRRRRSRGGSGAPFILAGAALAAFTATMGAASPARADDDGMLATPVLRLALGPDVHIAPEEDTGFQVALDLTAGFSAIMGDTVSGLAINPEIGYAYDSFGVHAFNATFGIGYGSPLAAVLYHPRLIIGSAEGNFAVGMRNGIGMHAIADMLSVELGHQFVSTSGALHHDIRILFGVNPAAFVFLMSEAARHL